MPTEEEYWSQLAQERQENAHANKHDPFERQVNSSNDKLVDCARNNKLIQQENDTNKANTNASKKDKNRNDQEKSHQASKDRENAEKNVNDANQKVADASAKKDVAQKNLDNAIEYHNRSLDKLEKAADERDKADTNLKKAQGDLNAKKDEQAKAEAELEEAKKSGKKKDIKRAEENLAKANAEVDTAQQNLSEAETASTEAQEKFELAQDYATGCSKSVEFQANYLGEMEKEEAAAIKEAEKAEAELEEAQNKEDEAAKNDPSKTQEEVPAAPPKEPLVLNIPINEESLYLSKPFFNGVEFINDNVPYCGSTILSKTEVNEKSRSELDPEDITSTGLPAIINPYAVMTLRTRDYTQESKLGYRDGIYTDKDQRWYDIDTDVIAERKDPSVQNLIKTFGQLGTITKANKKGALPYNYADFAYCKWFGKISNNHLITLRRYTHPVNASLELPDWDSTTSKDENKKDVKGEPFKADFAHLPMAQAVTWFGAETGNDLNSFMSFTAGLKWKELKSQINQVEEDQTDNTSNSKGSLQKGMFKMISIITGEGDIMNDTRDGMNKNDPYNGGPYSNRVQGPVNCIDSTYARDRGFKFDQSFTVKFQYSARSINNINTKAAMLDIIGNMLVLTYGVGAFWGGMNKCVGTIKAYPWKEGMKAWFAGDPLRFMKAMKNAVSAASNNIKSVLDQLAKNPKETLKQIAGMGAKAAFGQMVKALGDNPQQSIQYKALSTGEPVGEWHMVIGNPYNPIMTIGNLICDGCKFEFGKELGPDDFPTELTCTVTLKHGLPLDRIGIESLFNRGWGRVYTVPTALDEPSSAFNSKIDTSWNNSGGKSKSGDWGSYWDQLVKARDELHTARADAQHTIHSAQLSRRMFGDVYRTDEHIARNWH